MASIKTKARYFTFILYPESIPNEWEKALTNLGLAMAVSPLHDSDEKENKELSAEEKQLVKSGQKIFKKPHYHVLYVAKNPVTVESVRNKIKRILGDKSLSHIEIVDSVKNVYLYLTHESKLLLKKRNIDTRKRYCLYK